MRKYTNSISLKKGDIVDLFEGSQIIKWDVEEDQTLDISGEISDDGDKSVIFDYKVKAACITVPKEAYPTENVKLLKDGKLENASELYAWTDIGGYYLRIIRDGDIIKKVQLHNGYGDGHYHLRFIDGLLSR